MVIYENIVRTENGEYMPLVAEKPNYDEKAKQWHFPVGGSVASSAVAKNGTVYFGSCDKHMYALDAKNGTLKWKFKTGNPVISSPIVVGGIVYFCGNDGYFYAVSCSGDLVWRLRIGSEGESFSSPAVADGKIYFGTGSGYIYCANLDGKEEWKFRTGNKIVGSPSVVNDTVFITSYDGNCYALSTNGRLLWRFPLGNASGSSVTIVDDKHNEIWRFRKFNDRDPGRLSVKSGSAIFGSWDNHVYSLDIEDGRKKWDYIAGGLVGSSAIVVENRLYFGSYDNHLHCIDVEDGRSLWKLRTGGQIDSTPVFYNGMIYFGSYDGNIYALSLQGEKSWNFLTGGMIESTAEIKNGVLYIGSFDSYFYVMDLTTKKILWQFNTGLPPVQMKDQVDLVTETTSHRFTRWKPEVIRPKGTYDFKIESKSVPTNTVYQTSNKYESDVGAYSEKKKKKPEFGLF